MALQLQGMEKTLADVERYRLVIAALEAAPFEDAQVLIEAMKCALENLEAVVRASEEGRQLGWWMFCTSPELFYAFDVQPLCFDPTISGSGDLIMLWNDTAVDMGFPADICTVAKASLGAIALGMVPKPDIIITSSHPCDAIITGYASYKRLPLLKDVPMFSLESPYVNGERAESYMVREFKSLIAFLEEQTGKQLDVDRLKGFVEESNRANEYWLEVADLERAFPAPHNFSLLGAATLAFWFGMALPQGTFAFKKLAEHLRKRVAEKKGGIPQEKIRVFWYDVFPTFAPTLATWMEQEWGANIVVDLVSQCNYEPVDTSSLDSMLRGLGRKWWATPMARQHRGPVDFFTEDMVRLIMDYKIDCVIFPGHVGHKSVGSSMGMLREVCRDLGVPFLALECDVYDPRVTSEEVLRTQIEEFFKTVVLQ